MGAKVTFNPITRIIKVTQAPVLIDGELVVLLDVKVDLYGDQKEDWLTNANGERNLRPPISVIGGQTTPTGRAGNTFFLASDWKIEPYDADHIFRITGNLYSIDGKSPFITPQGAGGPYFVQIERSITNQVDTVVTGSGVTGADVTNIATQSAAAVFNTITEDGETFAQAMRLLRANAAGDIVVTDLENGVYEIMSKDGQTIRIAGTGTSGNRTISAVNY